MINIIKHGEKYVKYAYNGTIDKVMRCSCGCEWAYDKSEVHSEIYIGLADNAKETGEYGYVHYVLCPECGARISHDCTLHADSPDSVPEGFYDAYIGLYKKA